MNRAVLCIIGLLFLTAQCDDHETETLNPEEPVAFSQKFVYTIKTDQPFQAYLDTLAKLDLDTLVTKLNDQSKKMAFWINIYNSLVQAKIHSDSNIYANRNEFFKGADQVIGGASLSLDDIENGILRKKNNARNKAFCEKFQVDEFDPRIHFTLNCGATSCPPIAYYSPDKLEKELELAAYSFVTGDSKYDSDNNTLVISELFKWFEDDFGGRSGVLSLMKKHQIIQQDINPKIEYKTYDWNLDLNNYQ